MTSAAMLAAAVLALALAKPAAAEMGAGTEPAGAPKSPPAASDRFVILELYQAQRDLAVGDPRINLLFDSREGRSWVLQHRTPAGGGAPGYVWVEIPRAPARGGGPGGR